LRLWSWDEIEVSRFLSKPKLIHDLDYIKISMAEILITLIAEDKGDISLEILWEE